MSDLERVIEAAKEGKHIYQRAKDDEDAVWEIRNKADPWYFHVYDYRVGNTTVFYHTSCYDGFAAAWFVRHYYPDAEFVPFTYGMELPDCTNLNVWFVDCCPPASWIREGEFGYLTVHDHHASRRDELWALAEREGWSIEGTQETFEIEVPKISIYFDNNRSGAMMVRDHMMPGNKYQCFAGYIQDRDLWHWILLGSKQVNAWIQSHPFTFEAWDEAFTHCDLDGWIENAMKQGETILRYQEMEIASHVHHAKWNKVLGCWVTEACSARIISRIGEELAKKPGPNGEEPGFGATFFVRDSEKSEIPVTPDNIKTLKMKYDHLSKADAGIPDLLLGDTLCLPGQPTVVYSLRSRGETDVGEMAKAFGKMYGTTGGGHHNASGFTAVNFVERAIPNLGAGLFGLAKEAIEKGEIDL